MSNMSPHVTSSDKIQLFHWLPRQPIPHPCQSTTLIINIKGEKFHPVFNFTRIDSWNRFLKKQPFSPLNHPYSWLILYDSRKKDNHSDGNQWRRCEISVGTSLMSEPEQCRLLMIKRIARPQKTSNSQVLLLL